MPLYSYSVTYSTCIYTNRSKVEEGVIPEDMVDECKKRRQELIGKTYQTLQNNK